MKKIAVLLLVFFGFHLSASEDEAYYLKLQEFELTVDWLDTLKKGIFAGVLEADLQEGSNRIFPLQKMYVDDLGHTPVEFKTYIIAKTDKSFASITVEKQKMYLYYGARTSTSNFKRITYIQPTRFTSDLSFFRVHTQLLEISESLNQIYGKTPFDMKKNVQEKELANFRGFSLVRVELNADMSSAMLEDFLFMTWSKLEEERQTKLVDLNIEKSCSNYLSGN